MFPIRKHFLNSGDSLDRRRLEEDFLQAARSMNDLRDYSIARKSIRRRNFNSSSWMQFIWNLDERRDNFHYIGMRRLISSVCVDITFPDYTEVVVDWSCNVHTLNNSPPYGTATDAKIIILCPSLNGVMYWGGSDLMEFDWPWSSAAGNAQTRLNFDLQELDDEGEETTSPMVHTMSGSFAAIVPAGNTRLTLAYNSSAGTAPYDPRDASNDRKEDWVIKNATLVVRRIIR